MGLRWIQVEIDIFVRFFTISRCSEEKIFGGLRETYGKKWAVGDIIGVFLDTNDKTIGE